MVRFIQIKLPPVPPRSRKPKLLPSLPSSLSNLENKQISSSSGPKTNQPSPIQRLEEIITSFVEEVTTRRIKPAALKKQPKNKKSFYIHFGKVH
ncbi:hypothetical protein B9Z55_027077 [Caenorhabditis nigoni]|uniref:Uncharacterized protein n=1 Tax=Caenorhabditis nigoni TaxID=1611254 RepID=A0A2G5SII8_9PELO|nr:hypothetical protein B9Z55_027077 [Caenorhabditis nigoni]